MKTSEYHTEMAKAIYGGLVEFKRIQEQQLTPAGR